VLGIMTCSGGRLRIGEGGGTNSGGDWIGGRESQTRPIRGDTGDIGTDPGELPDRTRDKFVITNSPCEDDVGCGGGGGCCCLGLTPQPVVLL
jgi:hypothetical protein